MQVQIIKDILDQFNQGNITKTDAEYQASRELGGNWALDYVEGSPVFVKYDYTVEEPDLDTELEVV